MSKTLTCVICNCSFTRKYYYDQHMKSQKHVKRMAVNDTFLCSCGNKYLSRKTLAIHEKTCTFKEDSNAKIITLFEKRLNNVEVMLQEERVKNTKFEQQDKYIKQLETQVKSLEEALQNALFSPSQPSSPPQPTHPIITPRKRHKIPNAWRPIIATKQDQLCGICKNNLPLHYHLDHIVALQFGGTDHQDNLMALCYDCHVQKSKRELACREEIRHVVQNVLNMQAIHI